MDDFGNAGVDAAQRVADAMGFIPTDVTTRVHIVTDSSGDGAAASSGIDAATKEANRYSKYLDEWYRLPFEFRSGTTFDDWSKAQPQAEGGDYLVTKPTLFLAGEVSGSSERVSFSGATKQDMNKETSGGMSQTSADGIMAAIHDQTRQLKLAFKEAAIMA